MSVDPKSTSEPIDDLEFVYKVAFLAWKKGLTSNFIAKELKGAGDPRMIMRVKRALQRASKEGVLVLNPPVERSFQEELKKRWRRVDFTVARGEFMSPGDTVHLAASQVLSAKIETLWKNTKTDLVIANTGGRAVSETVRYLRQAGYILERREEIGRAHV